MHFAAFSNFSLEKFVPNLVSVTCPSLQIFGKTRWYTGVFPISGQSLTNENCRNSRTSNDIDVKLGQQPKPDKRNMVTLKNQWWRHVKKLWHRCHFTDLWSIRSNMEAGFRLTFSLIVTFYLTKTENRTKNLWYSSHAIALSKSTILTWRWYKNADIRKIKEVLVLKGIFSETNMCVCLRTKFHASSIILTSFR